MCFYICTRASARSRACARAGVFIRVRMFSFLRGWGEILYAIARKLERGPIAIHIFYCMMRVGIIRRF